jgi:hypothetical protein
MELHLKIIGVLLVLLSCIHVVFPKYFNWKDDLQALSLINRQMMVIHTFFIAIVVFLMGILCLISTSDMMNTALGKIISLGFGIFWSLRLIVQFFGYSPKLWKDKRFETTMHIIFSILWIYFSMVFWINATS